MSVGKLPYSRQLGKGLLLLGAILSFINALSATDFFIKIYAVLVALTLLVAILVLDGWSWE